MPNTDNLQEKTYLGDGVYAGHDGYHIVLWLEYGGSYGTDAIALDPVVLAALDRYRNRITDSEKE